MEEGHRSQSRRERAPETRNGGIPAVLTDYYSDYESRRKRPLEPIQFVSAGMWHGRTADELEREWELTVAARRRPPSAVGVWPAPGTLECESRGFRIMAAMGYEIGMGLGENGEGILAPLRYNHRHCSAGLGRINEPKAFYFQTNCPNQSSDL